MSARVEDTGELLLRAADGDRPRPILRGGSSSPPMFTGALRRPILVVLLLAVAGCGTWHNVRLTDAHTKIRKGDKVRYETKKGDKQSDTIVAARSDTLVGAKRSVPFRELKGLEVYRDRDGPLAWVLVIGLWVGLVAVLTPTPAFGPP